MNNRLDIAHRIGVSTFWLPAGATTLEETITQVRAAGLDTLEIVPADYQGVMGYPTVRSPGLWPRTFGREQRRRLRLLLQDFALVTVHGPHLGGLNLASINPGIRAETQRQFIECIELAVDLGVHTVTFHAGGHNWGYLEPPAEVIERSVEFGKTAVSYAEKHDLHMGYEVGSPFVTEIIDAIGSDRFGLNLDLGHAVHEGLRQGRPVERSVSGDGTVVGTGRILNYIQHFTGKVVEVHVHGVYVHSLDVEDHQPLDRNNIISFPQVVAALKGTGFAGPFVFELMANDVPTMLKFCQEGKQKLLDWWGS
jgi:sugar phosphate isomerase/epimerase